MRARAAVLHEVKKRAKDITLVALIDESLPDLVLVTRAAKADIASPNHLWLTKDDVTRLRKAKLRVVVWTVNEPAEMHRLLDLGVNGLVSDRADLLRDVPESRGAWS